MKNTVIAAVSTPPGKGGVAVIRISGEGALSVASSVFFPRGNKNISDIKPRFQYFGRIVYRGEEIDDGLLCYFKAPASFTGEDVVEISCHGGALITKTVLEALFAAGATPAERGEFTRRALLNGKLSLTDAEAIGNLLEAKSFTQIRLNTLSSRSILSEKISAIKASLIDTVASMYARIDYPDEDLGDFSDAELRQRLLDVKEELAKLSVSYKTGSAISEGIKTVICGRPNAGKSSLYNVILGREAAIVTDIEGTTRDVLTSDIAIGKVMLSLSDTAGVRDDNFDEIERLGIERTRMALNESALVLAVFDGSSEICEKDLALISELDSFDSVKIAVINKNDKEVRFSLKGHEASFSEIISISAKNDPLGARIKLSKIIDSLFIDEKISVGETAIISNARQNAAVIRALECIDCALNSLDSGFYQDAVASDTERALSEISELDGHKITEEILDDIFSKFCVGK